MILIFVAVVRGPRDWIDTKKNEVHLCVDRLAHLVGGYRKLTVLDLGPEGSGANGGGKDGWGRGCYKVLGAKDVEVVVDRKELGFGNSSWRLDCEILHLS